MCHQGHFCLTSSLLKGSPGFSFPVKEEENDSFLKNHTGTIKQLRWKCLKHCLRAQIWWPSYIKHVLELIQLILSLSEQPIMMNGFSVLCSWSTWGDHIHPASPWPCRWKLFPLIWRTALPPSTWYGGTHIVPRQTQQYSLPLPYPQCSSPTLQIYHRNVPCPKLGLMILSPLHGFCTGGHKATEAKQFSCWKSRGWSVFLLMKSLVPSWNLAFQSQVFLFFWHFEPL